MIHETQLNIRTFHTDAFGHVNNSKYLELLEEARWQFGDATGLAELLKRRNLGFIIVDMNLRFRVPVLESDSIVIRTSLVALGSASGDLRQWVYRNGEDRVALKSQFHFILIDRESGSAAPIDAEICELLLGVIEN